MTDPYIQINGTKIEVFDNDLSAVASLKQLSNASKIITATRDLAAVSGDVTYTGVGFTPSSLFAIGAAIGVTSMGMSDSSKVCADIREIGAGGLGADSKIIDIITSVDNSQTAIIKSYGNGEFTLTWTKTGSPTGTGYLTFLCLI